MSFSTFNFCGMDSEKDLGITVTEIKRSILPEIAEQKRSLPGIEIFEGTTIGAKLFTIDCMLEAQSDREAVLKMRDLAAFFKQTLDDEYPLIFSEESDVVYYSHVVELSECARVAQNTNDYTFTIKFSCSEGLGVGEVVETQLTETTTLITPTGNDTTYPIFTVVPKKELTSIAIADGEGGYMFLGGGFDTENQDTAVNQVPRILSDPCNTLASWTRITAENLTFNVENGIVSSVADMRTTGKSLRVSQKDGKDYFGGNVSKKWHGPARMQWLSSACDDWKVEARMYHKKGYARAMNKIEVYLLNPQGKRIGKIMLKDNDNSYEVLAHAQIGYDSNGLSRTVYSSNSDPTVKRTKNGSNKKKTIKYKEKYTKVTGKGKSKKKTTAYRTKTMQLPQDLDENTFTGFYGVCVFVKKGNVFTASFQKCDSNGKPIGKVWKKTITDKKGDFSKDQLGGIAVYMGKYDITEDSKNVPYTANKLALTDLKVYKILGDTEEIVARPGDEITFNCEESTVYKNGVRYMSNFYIGSEFLEMKGGIESSFAVSPQPGEDADWFLDYAGRYS